MFGHDDNTDKKITALPPDDTTVSPSDDITTPLPEPAAAEEETKPDYIATDRAGKPDASAAPTLSAAAGDLLGIKQQALKELTPLVDHLNQTPEEKFRTTMMMIQAADDQSLIARAYEAAKSITDEKTRAQALLDVINEINYFTQQHEA
ncbi:MAG TPA: hypothetical protein VFL85_02545 [Candidatus Saccharimonadales bacterium]|nr:hypothetical protein [Candidatus Saccharimonadales bacterium]